VWTELHIKCVTVWTELHIKCVTVWTELHIKCVTVWTELHIKYVTVWTELHIKWRRASAQSQSFPILQDVCLLLCAHIRSKACVHT